MQYNVLLLHPQVLQAKTQKQKKKKKKKKKKTDQKEMCIILFLMS